MNYSSGAVLTKILNSIQNKRKTVRLINGAIEFLLVTSASLGSASVLARFYSSEVYFSIIKTVAILSASFGFVKLMLPALLKRERTTEISMELEKVSPGLGEDTINAVLLMGEVQNEKRFGVSKSLVGAHIENVAARLESLDLSPSLPEEKIKSYRKPFTAVFMLSFIALVLSPSEFRAFLFSANILPPSEPYLLELADIKVNYHYPDYTGIPPKEVKGSSGDIDAVKGTNVTFEATPLKPLDRGNLIFEKGHIIPLNTEQGRIKAEFRIVSSGSFYVEDTAGKYRSRVFSITSLEDKNPRVSIENPSREIIEIDGQDRLDIDYKAEDDFGLTKLMLTWNTKKGESSRLIMGTKGGLKLQEGKFSWELGSADPDPGETIEVRVKAYDNDTVSGPKFGVSNTIKVKLRNPRKKHEDILTLADKLLNEMIDILGDVIESRNTLTTRQNSDSDQQDLTAANMSKTKNVQEVITIKIENILSPIDDLLVGMKTDEFSEFAYFTELSSMKTRIQGLLNERHDLFPSVSATDLPRLDNLISEEINEFEGDILFLDSMLKGEKLRESMLYGKDALRQYNELSELLEKLKNSGDHTTMDQLAKKVGELNSLVSELTEKLSSLSGDIGEGFLNVDAFDSIDLQGKLDEIMKLAESGKIEEALELLASLKTGIQNMIASLESSFQSFSLASLSKEMNKLNEIISRLGNIEKKQTSLKDRTINLKDSLLKSPGNKQSMSDFLGTERKKIERLKSMLFETKTKVSPNIPEYKTVESSLLIDRAISRTDELEHWLQALDFEEALKQSKELENDATEIKDLSKLVWGIADGDSEAEKPLELAREIRRDLENALQAGTENGQSFRIAKTQDELEKETSGVGDDITEFQNGSFLLPIIGEKLGESREFMRGASGNMKTNEISKAISNQEEAIKKLESAREQAEELLKNYKLSSKGMGMSVPLVLGNQFQQGSQGVDTGHVEIPAPEESQIGKEFKESLLKALKDGSPEGYSELNKRYYDRIIK